MKLRSLPILLMMAAALGSTAAQATPTGNLRFAGLVNAGTCNLAAGDANRTITLPTVKVPDFDSAVSAGALDFNITAECESDISNVIFLFAGTASTGNGLLFSNTGTSQGVALWLMSLQPNALTIPANGTAAQRSRTVATSANKAVMPLRAAYHRDTPKVTSGTLASIVTVSITYN